MNQQKPRKMIFTMVADLVHVYVFCNSATTLSFVNDFFLHQLVFSKSLNVYNKSRSTIRIRHL